MLERDVESYLVKRVKALGGEVRKVNWVGRNGAPDRLVMLPGTTPGELEGMGRAFWVELKTPGQKAKPHQVREHARMQKLGQTVFVVDSLEGVDAVLA